MAVSDEQIKSEEKVKGFTVTQLAERMIAVHKRFGITTDRAPTYDQWDDERGKFPRATTIQNGLSGGWAQVAKKAELHVPHSRSTKSGVHPLDEPVPRLAEIGNELFKLERGGNGMSFYQSSTEWKFKVEAKPNAKD